MWSDSQDNTDFASKPKIAGGWNKRTKGCCMYVTDIKYETPLSKINILIKIIILESCVLWRC